MIPAKKFGGKVTQYFIGFGPTVWSTQRGETEYGVKAVPLGGYVKIVGMLPPGAEELDEDRETVRRGRQPRRHGPQVQHRDVHPADLRRPRGRVGAHQARGLRPALLQDAVVEEGHRDGRRADGEHPDRVLHLPRASSRTYGNRTDEPESGSPVIDEVSRLRGARAGERPRVHGRRPGGPGARRPGSSPATRSCRSTAPRSPAGPAAGPDPRQRRRPGRDRRASATAGGHHDDQHDGRRRARRRPPTTTVVEVGFLGVVPTDPRVVTTGGPIYTLEQMGT